MTGTQAEAWPAGRALGASVSSGLLCSLAQEPFGIGWLALVGLAPLFWACRGRDARRRAGLGFVAGTVHVAASTTLPVGASLARFLELPLGATALFPLLLLAPVFGGGGYALLALLLGDPARRPGLAVPRAGAALVLAESLRSAALGVPWLPLAWATLGAPDLAGIAVWAGGAGLGFFLGAANASAASLLPSPGRAAGGRGQALAWALSLAALALAARAPGPLPEGAPGSLREVAAGAPRSPGAVRVLLVQPGGDGRRDLGAAFERLDRMVALAQAGGGADWILWPETAFPLPYPENRAHLEPALARLPRAAWVVLGAPRSAGGVGAAAFNSALLFDEARRLHAVHDKSRLVPITERVPFTALRRGLPELRAGPRPAPWNLGAVTVAPLICFEAIYGEPAGSMIERGARVLVNLSNDAWFGASGGAAQHLAGARLRAAELGLPLLRVTTTGATVAQDARGRLRARLDGGGPGTLSVDLWPASGAGAGAAAGRIVELASCGLWLLGAVLERRAPAALLGAA